MQRFLIRLPKILIILVLLILIIEVIKDYHLQDIVNELRNFSNLELALIPILVFLNFFTLSFIEYTALNSVTKSQISFKTAALSSFLANAFSYNLGATVFVGGFFRYKILNSFGINSKQIIDVILLISVHYILALFTSLGIVSCVTSVFGYQRIFSLEISGLLALISVSGLIGYYFFINKRRVLKFFKFKFLTPTQPVVTKMLILCVLDWFVHYSVYYFCIPGHDISFQELAMPFLLSYCIGLISGIPGGFGLFESIVFFSLKNTIKPESLIAGLMVYRVFMNLLPLILASIIYTIFELTKEQIT